MSYNEKRKRKRSAPILDDPVLIEIEHPFGPIKKAVYRVREFDEFGLSFLIPSHEGYFLPGTPLEFRFDKGDGKKIHSYGIVRYYHRQDEAFGESFYRIGLEIDASYRNASANKYAIRPKRYSSQDKEKRHFMCFSLDEKNWEFELIDISRYSAAFFCSPEEALSLRVSTALGGVQVFSNGDVLYEGSVIITQALFQDKTYKIVVEPRHQIFNVDLIEKQESLDLIIRSADELREKYRKFSKVDPVFKSIVADTRCFLEDLKTYLESPQILSLSKEIPIQELLETLKGLYFDRFDRRIGKFDKATYAAELSDEDLRLHKAYFQNQLLPLLLPCPFWHRIYFKPLGYAGDYETIRMIDENRYEGPNLYAQILNKYALETPLSQASRNRTHFLSDKIATLVRESNLSKFNILSIGSGPALEIEKFIQKNGDMSDRISLTLLDQEIEALRFSQENIYKNRIIHNSKLEVSFIHKAVGSYLKEVARKRRHSKKYHLIYIFGLFDYFDDKTCKFILRHIQKLLMGEGTVMLSNYSLDGHYHRILTEFCAEWYLIYRNREGVRSLCDGLDKLESFKVDEEDTGVIKFLEMHFH